MRFLPDENVSRFVVERPRAVGFDVASVGATRSGASDNDVLAAALGEGRILITEDRDFGELVVRQRLEVPGVVLLELDRLSNTAEAHRVAAILSANTDKLARHLTVIEPGRVRIRPLAQQAEWRGGGFDAIAWVHKDHAGVGPRLGVGFRSGSPPRRASRCTFSAVNLPRLKHRRPKQP